jgi:hypothetical protein
MLNKETLVSGLKDVRVHVTTEFQEALDKKLTALEEKLYSGELAPQDYLQEVLREVQDDSEGLNDEVLDIQAKALADYLNGMQDVTGDGLLVSVGTTETREFFSSLSDALGDIKGNSLEEVEASIRVQIPGLKTKWIALWTAAVAKTFLLTTPPPGSATKVSSVILPPTQFPDPSDLLLDSKGELVVVRGTVDEYYEVMADIFDQAARSLTHLVNHVLPTTPPSPGPPITAPVS